MSPRKPRRPAVVVVEPIRARPIRGPHRDGSGRWYWQARVFQGERGGDRTVWSGWGRRDEVADALVALIAEQGHAMPAADPTVQTVRDLLEVWVAALQRRPDLSVGYLSMAPNAARRLCEVMGDVHLDRVTADTLDRVRDDMLRGGVASGTVKRNLKVLRSAWNWGHELRLVERELPRFRVKVEPARNRRAPPRDEVLRVVAEMRGWPRLLTQMLYATGARIGEIAALTWRDVDLEAGMLSIRISKTGARQVPLHPDMVGKLREWMRDTDLEDGGIFRIKPQGISSKYGSRYLDRACEAAGVPRFTAHGLRKAAVDALQRAGVDVGTAAALLGHSPTVMLRHYRQANIDDLRRAVATTDLGGLSRDAGVVIPFPGSSEA